MFGAAGAAAPSTARIRRRFDSLSSSDDDYAAFADGLREMRRRSDKLSLGRMVSIHMKSGQHGNWLFFPWHRMHLLRFEAVIAQLTGHASFALPYWDYAGDRQLPARLTWDKSPLYHAGRKAEPGLDYAQARWGMNQSSADLLRDPFETFVGGPGAAGRVEAYGHNLVHSLTGGDMGSLDTAPLDPLFWMHHCNVDRVFASWQKLDRRDYPAEWARTNITGFGKGHDRNVASLLDLTALRYAYDRLYPFPNFSVPITPPPGRRIRERVSSREFTGRAVAKPGKTVIDLALPDEALAALREDGEQLLDIDGSGVVSFSTARLRSKVMKVVAAAQGAGQSARPVTLSAATAFLMQGRETAHHGGHAYSHWFRFGPNISNLIGRSDGNVVLSAFAEPLDAGMPGTPALPVSLDYKLSLTTHRWV